MLIVIYWNPQVPVWSTTKQILELNGLMSTKTCRDSQSGVRTWTEVDRSVIDRKVSRFSVIWSRKTRKAFQIRFLLLYPLQYSVICVPSIILVLGLALQSQIIHLKIQDPNSREVGPLTLTFVYSLIRDIGCRKRDFGRSSIIRYWGISQELLHKIHIMPMIYLQSITVI